MFSHLGIACGEKQEAERSGALYLWDFMRVRCLVFLWYLGEEVVGKVEFPPKTCTEPRDGQFGALWKNVDPWILVISQENLQDVLRMGMVAL